MITRRPSEIKLNDALMEARHLIKTKQSRFICLALAIVIRKRPDLALAANYLQEYIEEQLGFAGTLESWQSQNRNGRVGADKQVRQDRLAWIDWMIASLWNQHHGS